jgi:hypothetical protein
MFAADDAQEPEDKRRKRKRVSFGPSHVRYVQDLADIDSDHLQSSQHSCHEEQEHAAPTSHQVEDQPPKKARTVHSCRKTADQESTEEVKESDGPAEDSMFLNQLMTQLFTKRDASILTGLLRILVEHENVRVLEGMRKRLELLVDRVQIKGKTALLPSCLILRKESLPVLEWTLDCMDRAVQYLHLLRRNQADMILLTVAKQYSRTTATGASQQKGSVAIRPRD